MNLIKSYTSKYVIDMIYEIAIRTLLKDVASLTDTVALPAR